MDASTLIESFADFAKQKNIDRPTMIRILEDVFRNMIKKKKLNQLLPIKLIIIVLNQQ